MAKLGMNVHEGPMGKVFSVQVPDTNADIVSVSKHAGLSPAEAREALKSMIDQIPDANLTRFLGAQMSVVT